MSNITDVIYARTSASSYDSQRKLDDAEISALIDLATQAPSAFNAQNWKFIAVRSEEAKARLLPLAYNQSKVTDAAVTFIICGTLQAHVGLQAALQPTVDAGIISAEIFQGWVGAAESMYQDNAQLQRDEAVRSASLAAMTLMLAAQCRGLISCPMIGFNAAAVAEQFELDAIDIPVMLLTVGYATEGNWPKKPRKEVAHILHFV